MEEKIEQLLSNINDRITDIDEKQTSLEAYILGLAKHHILGLLYSVRRRSDGVLSYVLAITALGVTLFVSGKFYQEVAGRGAMMIGMILGISIIVYAIVITAKLQKYTRAIDKLEKEAKDIMSDTEQLKAYLIGKVKK